MLSFAPLPAEKYEWVRCLFGDNPYRTCDYTAGTTYLWRHFFATEYAEAAGCLLCRARYLDGEIMYSVPVGADPKAALFLLREELSSGERLRFCFVPEAALPLLQETFSNVTWKEEPDWADYLYDREAFVFLRGKKYHGQKNFVNRFKKKYPDYALVPLSRENLPSARDFLHRWQAQNRRDDPMARAEYEGVLELLNVPDLWGMEGVLLTAAGQAAGLTVGEVAGDTLYVHVEKGDTAYEGVYPMLASSFAACFDGSVRYINREEDMGDEGLRRAKESWHPLEKRKKYTVWAEK